MAEQTPDDPDVQTPVLALLAQVETACVTQRGRF